MKRFIRPNMKPHREKWLDVERKAIAAMLYHSDSIQDCQKFLAITDEVGWAWKEGSIAGALDEAAEEEK